MWCSLIYEDFSLHIITEKLSVLTTVLETPQLYSITDTAFIQGNGWTYEDMIRTNEEKFNVSSMYDENMAEYTVPVPECDEETKKKAAQLAEDIEKKVTTNVHVAEERGQIVPTDLNEEDR